MTKETLFRPVLREDGWALVLRMSPLDDTEVALCEHLTRERAEFLTECMAIAFDNWYGDEEHEFDY